jgi:CRISPR/Cas system-associated exonuclease Cas4 (RecB family)
MDIPLQNMLNDELRKGRENREQKNWYASSLGSCLRGQYISRLNIIPKEFDDRTLRVFKCGNIFEEFIINLLKGRTDIQIETQTRLEVPEFDAVGKPDLIITYNGERKVYEIKSKHSAGFKYIPQEQHRQQIWFYLYALKISEGNLVYVSKDDLRIAECPIRFDDKELSDSVIKEFNVLNEAWSAKDIELLPLPEKNAWQSKYCQFHDYCVEPEKLLTIKAQEAIDYPN